MVLAETPVNPTLDVVDLHRLAMICRGRNATLVVDNTTPTPLGQQPLSLGADLVVASATKALSGHSDLVAGYVAGCHPELMASIERERMLVPLPFGIARLKAMFLQFAPGALKLTPDQVALLRIDNVVSDAAKAAGLTLEGLGITPDSLEAVAPQYLWRFRKMGQFQKKSA